MRGRLSVLALIAGLAPASAQKVEWWVEDSGRVLNYGVRDTGTGGLKASCRDVGYDVVLAFPEKYPGRYREGQTATVSLQSGRRELPRLSGVLIDNQGEGEWLISTKVGEDHPLFQSLFSGESIKVGAPGYRLDVRGNQHVLTSFRTACMKR